MARWQKIWIAELKIDPTVILKIDRKHSLSRNVIVDLFLTSKRVLGIEQAGFDGRKHFLLINGDEKLPRVIVFAVLLDEKLDIWMIKSAFRSSNSHFNRGR